MYQNIITLSNPVPVVILFGFQGEFKENGLNTFTRLSLKIGDETYDTQATPSELYVENGNELHLNIGSVTSLKPGEYIPTILGYSPRYNGYELNSPRVNKLRPIKIV